ncbi:MAG: hypothetical protein GY896_02890 [Gammaproteobacteria bacterium]|nr:hypothetical protein [Gammaproteobacteria bacterium]
MAQRIYQIACGYEDGNDANHLRTDLLFEPGVGRKPLDHDNDLASASTFSRLETVHHSLSLSIIDSLGRFSASLS